VAGGTAGGQKAVTESGECWNKNLRRFAEVSHVATPRQQTGMQKRDRKVATTAVRSAHATEWNGIVKAARQNNYRKYHANGNAGQRGRMRWVTVGVGGVGRALRRDRASRATRRRGRMASRWQYGRQEVSLSVSGVPIPSYRIA